MYPNKVCGVNGDWLDDGRDHNNIDFALPRGGRFKLKLEDPNGAPPDIPIWVSFDAFEPDDTAFPRSACESLWLRTDENVEVETPFLPPAPYWVFIGTDESEEFLERYLYQGYCGFIMFNATVPVPLESDELNDLGTCELIPVDQAPISARSGSLFFIRSRLVRVSLRSPANLNRKHRSRRPKQ